MIKSRSLKWAGHVARMEEGRNGFKLLTGKLTVKRLYEGLGVDRKTVLEWTLNKWVWVDSPQHSDYSRTLVNAALNLRVP